MNFVVLLAFKLTLLWLYFGKSCKTTIFRKSKGVSQNRRKFISIGPPIMKFVSTIFIIHFLAAPFSKNKVLTFGIFNKSNIWAQVYHIWKIEVYVSTIVEITGRRSCYLSSLNIVVTSAQNSSKLGNTAFWRLFLKKMSAKCLKLFGPPTTKWRPCKVFAKLNGYHCFQW